MMQIRIACVTALAGSIAGVLLLSGAAYAADPIGTWYTAENRAQVRITHCSGDALCGAIVWLKEPNDPQSGKPKTDIHNPEAAKRSRAIVGLRIMFGLTPSSTPDKWQGQIYNPDDGGTYGSYVTMTGANALQLKGCVLGGLICKSENWTRVR